jgi:hypothetical protein
MKTKIEDSEVLAPHADGNTIAGGVKAEITFLWAEVDEGKPARQARESIEETNIPIFLNPKDTNPKERNNL